MIRTFFCIIRTAIQCGIREEGSHQELLVRGGLYCKLYKLQYEHGMEPVEV